MSVARTCSCGRRVEPGQVCVCKAGQVPRFSQLTEAQRMMTQPYRVAYKDPAYRANRLKRYELVRGYCEGCGVSLKGSLHERGVAWDCDHQLEARLFADPRTANAIENLRCYCRTCHKAKTKARRGRG